MCQQNYFNGNSISSWDCKLTTFYVAYYNFAFTPKSAEKNVTSDVDTQQSIAPTRSSSNRSLSSYARSCVPDQELFEASLLLRRFTFQDLMLATRTFKVENFHDEEGFGILLKGWINPYGNYAARPGTGIPIAVKALNFNESQDHKEWLVCDANPN